MRFTIEGKTYDYNGKLRLSEAIIIKQRLGLNMLAFEQGLEETNPLSLQALAWLVRFRAGERELDPRQVDFVLDEFAIAAPPVPPPTPADPSAEPPEEPGPPAAETPAAPLPAAQAAAQASAAATPAPGSATPTPGAAPAPPESPPTARPSTRAPATTPPAAPPT